MLAWGYVIHFLRTIIMSNSLLGPSLQNMTEFVKQNKQTNHIYYKIPFHKTGWSWERVRRSGFNPPPFIRPVGYFNYFPATKILPTTGSHAIVRCEQKKSLIALKNVLGRRVNKISWISGFKLGLPPPRPPFQPLHAKNSRIYPCEDWNVGLLSFLLYIYTGRVWHRQSLQYTECLSAVSLHSSFHKLTRA